MIVGFVITDYQGSESIALDYIKKVCILEGDDVAKNIVAAGPGLNIYSMGLDIDELNSQPFSYTLIDVPNGKYLLVSIVNFNIELLYNKEVLRLSPTENKLISYEETFQFESYIKQGLVRIIPDVNPEGDVWILAEAKWNDEGIWIDSDYWRDSK